MGNENIRDLRDTLDDRRQIVVAMRGQDPAKALELRNRAHAAWQDLTKAVSDHGSRVFLPRKLSGDENWYVQVLWPNGDEEHISTFRNEAEAVAWIEKESADWSRRRDTVGVS